MTMEEEIRIKILNREKYLKRPCTEEEKKNEVVVTRFDWSRRKEGEIIPKITKEEFLQIVKEEGLSEYVQVEINSYEWGGEYCALINQIEEYYREN